MMKAIDTIYKHEPDRPRQLVIKATAKRSLYYRCRRWVAEAFWNLKMPLYQKVLDIICLMILALSGIYFVGVLVFF